MSSKCPVCNTDIPEIQRVNGSFEMCSCQRCGDFHLKIPLSSLLSSILENDNKKIAVLSHWIRTRYESKVKEPPDEQYFRKIVTLDNELVNSIIKNSPLNPAEQADNLIRWLGENSKGYGEFLGLEPKKDLSIIGSETPEGFIWIIHHLIDSGIIEGNITSQDMDIRLSFDGWKYFEKLKQSSIDSRKAFIAMEYGDKQLDKFVDEVFKPAVRQTGFDLFRLVDRPQPAGLIDDQLRVEIQTSRFLIADLTHENAGAYWEAGYAEGLGKPVIYTCEKKKFEEKKTHFDTNHHLTVIWDYDNSHEAAEELKATIRATLPGEAKLTDD